MTFGGMRTPARSHRSRRSKRGSGLRINRPADVDKGPRITIARLAEQPCASRHALAVRQCMKMTTSLDLRFTTRRRVQYRDDRALSTGASCNEIAGKAMIDE